MINPIKKLPKIIKTARLEMRQLDGIARQGGVYHDDKLYDNMIWSKLKSEYKGK